MSTYDFTARCTWDRGLLRVESTEPPTAVSVRYPGGSRFFGVPTALEQELMAKNAKLRELVRDVHATYVEVVNICESLGREITWELFATEGPERAMRMVAEQKSDCDQYRHRFDAAMRELGIEV